MKTTGRRELVAAIIVLIVFYTFFFIGLLLNVTKDFFLLILPFHFSFPFLIIMLFHKNPKTASVLFFIIVYLASLTIEMIAVRTGLIFGNYQYRNHMGPVLLSVPLVAGLNWLLLIYCTGNLVNKIKINSPWKEMTGASFMTLIGYLQEHIYNHYGWKHWQGGEVTGQYYLAVFYVSFLFLLYFFRVKTNMSNALAVPLLIILVNFLAAVNILIATG